MPAPEERLTTLESLRPGDAARVVDVTGTGAFRRRLLDMGFIRGALVRVIRDAPLSNPVEYCVGRTHITLRRQESRHIVVAPFGGRPRRGGRHGPPHGRGRHRPSRGKPWWRRGPSK